VKTSQVQKLDIWAKATLTFVRDFMVEPVGRTTITSKRQQTLMMR